MDFHYTSILSHVLKKRFKENVCLSLSLSLSLCAYLCVCLSLSWPSLNIVSKLQSFRNTTGAYRRLSLAALACLPAGQRGVILTLLPNIHSVISVLVSEQMVTRIRRTFAKLKLQRLLIVIIVKSQCCKCSYCDYCDL